MAVFDCVFEGGGARGVALSGGVAAFTARGHSLGRLVGTSAGAITATSFAVGYTPEEVLAGSVAKTPDGKPIYTTFNDPPKLTRDELQDSQLFKALNAIPVPLPRALEARMDLEFLKLLAHIPQFASLVLMFEKGGLYRGDAFLEWMKADMEARGEGFGDATFAGLFARTGKDLSILATDTTAREKLVLNHRTAPDVPVRWAVRMSMSIPFYWEEVRWKREWGPYRGRDLTGHAIVDGGVVSNFPLGLLVDADEDEVIAVMGPAPSVRNPVVGFYLDEALEVPGQPPAEACGPTSPLVGRIEGLINTMMSADDNAVIDEHATRVIRLPVAGYGVTEFDMAEARVRALYDAGTAAAAAWLDAQ